MDSRDVFTNNYERLVAATKARPDPVHFEECWRIAEQFPLICYSRAVERLMETCEFMPSVAEWKTALVEARRQVEAEYAQSIIEASHVNPATFHCPDCKDTGFKEIWHPESRDCPVQLAFEVCHKHHEVGANWMHPCRCRDTNPVLLKAEEKRKAHLQGRSRGRDDG